MKRSIGRGSGHVLSIINSPLVIHGASGRYHNARALLHHQCGQVSAGTPLVDTQGITSSGQRSAWLTVMVSKDKMKEREGLAAEKPGQTESKDYSRSGGCKYEKACSFNPRRGEPSVAPILECNFLGLPIRPGEKDCSFYMRNASCMFGTNCRFNHPDPTAARESDPPSGYGNGGSASLQGASSSTAAPWSAPRSLNDAPLYVPMVIPPSQGIPSQNTEWNGYQALEYLPERSMPTHPPICYEPLSH